MGKRSRRARDRKRKTASTEHDRRRRQQNRCSAAAPQPVKLLEAAVADHQAGRFDDAEAKYRQVLQQQPKHPDALHLLGVVAHHTGRHRVAVDLITEAIAINDSAANYHYNLGLSLSVMGDREKAIASYERAIALDPNCAAAYNKLGHVLVAQGRRQDAVGHFRQAVTVDPQFLPAHNSLAAVLKDLGRLEEAAECFQRALALKPSAEAYSNLGVVYHEQGKLDLAMQSLTQAVSRDLACAAAHNNLAEVYLSQGKADDAVASYRRALAVRPDFVEALDNLGNVLRRQGKIEPAADCFRRALTLRPDLARVHSNLLFCLNHDGRITPDELFAEHCRWGEVHGRVSAELPPHTNEPVSERRLRIGYVSPDLRDHAVARFFEPVLAHHDSAQVETWCYAEVSAPDQVTARVRSLANRWQFTCGMTDEQLARQIHADRIDILVDLAGHTANNRLGTFAYRPAPVQVTWLGYPNTTGLKTIDYRLTDVVADPPHKPTLGTEELIWLRGGVACFAPPTNAPDAVPPPSLRNGCITFGSLHRLDKLTAEVLDVWCRILHELPNARMLAFRDTLHGNARCNLEQEFLNRGISASRLELQHHCRAGYLSVYNKIDILLDVFPWGGGTTSCESLWMGVPVVTLSGDRFASRGGAYLLARVGVSELIAKNTDEYVSVALRTASDVNRLAELRSNLRGRMAATVCDSLAVTQGLEEAYHEMWRRWCARERFRKPSGAP